MSLNKPTSTKNVIQSSHMLKKEFKKRSYHTLALVVSTFFKRGLNKGLVEVTGTTVNRGGGYGLEIPCNYHFYGSKSFIKKLQRLVDSLCKDGHLYHENCCALAIHVLNSGYA